MADELAALDISRIDRFVDGSVDALLAKLRAEAPVHWCPSSPVGPYWSITRYEDIVEISGRPDVFSSASAQGGMSIVDHAVVLPVPMFIAMDPPDHAERRRATTPMFASTRLVALQEDMRAHVNAVLDTLPRPAPFDWVEQVSAELALRTLATLLGFPHEQRSRLRHWAELVVTATPTLSPAERYREMIACLQTFTALRRMRAATSQGEDLISMLVHNPVTARMPAAEFLGTMLVMVVGGYDTSRSVISGSLIAFERYPRQREMLEAEPERIADLAPELIRWQSPVHHTRRTALQDVEFRGRLIRRGDKVVLWHRSANRDEAVFEDGHRLELGRPNARRHLGFGFGIHRCVAARLAEMQIRIVWEEILRRGMRFKITEPPRVNYSNFINGFDALMVEVSG